MFVHLNVHSEFSLLSGTLRVSRIPALARERGLPCAVLTDSQGLYGAVPFVQACAREGIKPILGAETGGQDRALILARNPSGLAALNRLITSWHLSSPSPSWGSLPKERNRRSARVDPAERGDRERVGELLPLLSDLPEEGVFILSSSISLLSALRGRKGLFAELYAFDDAEGCRKAQSTRTLARSLEIPALATARVHFESPRDLPFHRLLSAIRVRGTLGNLAPGETVSPSCFFRPEAEMRRIFAELPEALDATGEIASACSVDLGLGKLKPSLFTKAAEPPALLRHEARAGLKRRLGSPSTAARELLEKELAVIEGAGMADTFLICWDLVDWARRKGIPSVGRGSAANSLVSFSLGITHVNPLEHNLFFERFLNPQRTSPPDLDIDFGTEEREEVFRYLFQTYGEERCAMVGTHNKLHARGALREAAKALGYPESEAGPHIKRISYHEGLDSLPQESQGLEDFPGLLPWARRLEEFPRHIATHPCGVIVAPTPVTDYCPLQRGDKGYEITQWDMNHLEDAGLIKFDILGQKGLAVILDTKQSLPPSGDGEKIGREQYPDYSLYLSDSPTREALAAGRTIGCYYVESPVMIQMLRQGRCRDFETLTALSSIIRPGVSNHGGKTEYLRRLLGLDPVTYLDPLLEPILKDSLGCLIYQEQVVRIAAELGSMSLAEADLLRRAMSWKKRGPTDLSSTKAAFLASCEKRGVRNSQEIWRRLESFANYAFCKAHSASFALESFESLYYKVHHPALFMAAVLSNRGGFYDASEYIEESRRLGLEILLPHINHSDFEFKGEGVVPLKIGTKSAEGEDGPPMDKGSPKAEGTIRVGLMAVRLLDSENARSIVEDRAQHGPYAGLPELRSRLPSLSRPELENLARCGALDGLGQNRAELLWGLSLPRGTDTLRKNVVCPQGAVGDWSDDLKARAEVEILGFSPRGHPLTFYRERILKAQKENGVPAFAPACRLAAYAGKSVCCVGWWVTAKKVVTKNTDRATGGLGEGERQSSSSSQPMMFATFSDKTGRFEAVLFPQAYARNRKVLSLKSRGPYLIRGRVETELGVCQVNITNLALA